MSNTNYEKYLKYKLKYLELKNELEGGNNELEGGDYYDYNNELEGGAPRQITIENYQALQDLQGEILKEVEDVNKKLAEVISENNKLNDDNMDLLAQISKVIEENDKLKAIQSEAKSGTQKQTQQGAQKPTQTQPSTQKSTQPQPQSQTQKPTQPSTQKPTQPEAKSGASDEFRIIFLRNKLKIGMPPQERKKLKDELDELLKKK